MNKYRHHRPKLVMPRAWREYGNTSDGRGQGLPVGLEITNTHHHTPWSACDTILGPCARASAMTWNATGRAQRGLGHDPKWHTRPGPQDVNGRMGKSIAAGLTAPKVVEDIEGKRLVPWRWPSVVRSSNPHVGRDYRLEVLSSVWLRRREKPTS